MTDSINQANDESRRRLADVIARLSDDDLATVIDGRVDRGRGVRPPGLLGPAPPRALDRGTGDGSRRGPDPASTGIPDMLNVTGIRDWARLSGRLAAQGALEAAERTDALDRGPCPGAHRRGARRRAARDHRRPDAPSRRASRHDREGRSPAVGPHRELAVMNHILTCWPSRPRMGVAWASAARPATATSDSWPLPSDDAVDGLRIRTWFMPPGTRVPARITPRRPSPLSPCRRRPRGVPWPGRSRSRGPGPGRRGPLESG